MIDHSWETHPSLLQDTHRSICFLSLPTNYSFQSKTLGLWELTVVQWSCCRDEQTRATKVERFGQNHEISICSQVHSYIYTAFYYKGDYHNKVFLLFLFSLISLLLSYHLIFHYKIFYSCGTIKNTLAHEYQEPEKAEMTLSMVGPRLIITSKDVQH